ncbi:MAG: transglycosylase domain-containing protein [Gammaproteobacteria bacterium]
MRDLGATVLSAIGRLRLFLERRYKVLLAGGGALVVVGAASFGPVVRWRATAEAERRGLTLEVEQVRPAWWGIELRGVRVAPEGVKGAAAELGTVRVGFGLGLSVREVEVHGGALRLSGTADELSKQVAEWRKRRPRGSGEGGGGTRMRLAVDGIDLVWRGLGPEPTYAWGLRFERAEDGSEKAGVDRIRAPLGAARLEARRTSVAARRIGERRVVERVIADGIEATLNVDAARTEGELGQAGAQKPKAGTRPASATVRDDPFVPDATRGPKLRAALRMAATTLEEALPPGGVLTLAGLRVRVIRRGEALNIGPSELRIERTREAAEIALVPGARADRGATPLALRATLPFAESAVRFEIEGGPISLAALGVQEGNFGLIAVQDATIEAKAKATLSADGTVVGFAGNGKLNRVSIKRAELAPDPLHGIRLGFSVRGDATLDGSRIRVEEGELTVGEVKTRASLDITRSPEGATAKAKGGVPLASCQALLDALPEGLAPRLASVRLSGTFALDAELAFDSSKPADTQVRIAVKNECRVSELPPELSPRRFLAPWTREVKGPDSLPMQVDSGPGTPTWIPFDAISPYMEAAILVCEDGRFPHHRGFDFRAIENSIRDNLKAGRFVRGASTVTMQLAKNLYLGQEKTLSRKLQEAVFTMLLEQELSKVELLELYLNVVEFGPGIYGIGPAAHHYFAKHPRDLTLGQAMFLASILPDPDAQHFRPDGYLSPGWSNYLRRLMKIAHERKRISDEELEAGLAEQVGFRMPGDVPHAPPPPPGALDDDAPPELPTRGALGHRD